MSLYREELEPHMYPEKRRRRKSYKWAKRQMNKWLRLQNKKIEGEDAPAGYKKKRFLGWEY